MIYQDVHRNAMQAHMKYKAYYDKMQRFKAQKKTEYVYVSQPKADHQVSKIRFTEYWWIGPYLVEKVLPKNIYLVRKIGTNRTQVIHRIQMRQFTAHQPPADIRITSGKWKPDPEVGLKHDDLYARAWKCENEQPIFDPEKNNATAPNSRKTPVQSDLSTEEMRNTPRTAQECSLEIFLQIEQLCDLTGTYPDMEPDVETSSEQPNNSPTNPHSSKCNIRHKPDPKCNDDYRY